MKKIFIPTPLDETIELPTDVTHHVLHVFRHNMEKPITVTGSDNRCGTYQITEEIDGKAQAKLIEYVESNVSSYRTILVQSLLKGEKLSQVLDIESDALKLVAYENEDGHTIKDVLSQVNADKSITDILICIGPEGGYQEKEINAIIESGGKSVSLGNTILRAETAAIGSLAMIQYELEL